MKSDNVKTGIDKAAHRSLMKALGWTDEEIKKPIIGIVSAHLICANAGQGNILLFFHRFSSFQAELSGRLHPVHVLQAMLHFISLKRRKKQASSFSIHQNHIVQIVPCPSQPFR